MTRQLLDETIAYLRKELTSIHYDLTWADGAQAESFRVRQMRLLAELDRLEALRRTMAAPVTACNPTSSAYSASGISAER
ncbi:MAG: hypothetical protein D6709_07430 [Chloroflexi bacterium]|jgi:hypothetical protein|uniref:Uncharacterized protein n=1 Tax=Candidatus Thermofonsia Clade 3 bacterium TaxID=2364212 RepID=A0A2M8QE09_9CHLR|nr:hypothetical protein [Candidatus Roseilinea sp. NK_OTU-006]PJF48043.1 MAG: hypothetical protein CUN48_05580 [Candidatus Thermofonsia Clade 3 bacterium]RMG63807.1 MAG: hypothetical protein D6709_07430 [Chloroflexota bacterium]